MKQDTDQPAPKQLGSEQQAGLHRAPERLRRQKATEESGQYSYALLVAVT